MVLSQEVSPKPWPPEAPLSTLALLHVPTAAVVAPCPLTGIVPVSPAPAASLSPGQGSLCGPSSGSAFHASGKRGFLRPLLPSLPLSQHAGCSHKGGSICVVWREAAWHRFWTPPSPDTFPTSPVLLFLCVVESKTSLQAWLIFRRLHSQRHPFTSQNKRTPNGPDLSLQGPMWGPCIEQSTGWKQGRKEFVCACLADCPCLGLEFI